MPQKIILDTDIGDDIDDALALGLILSSPELHLVGVTTVFKNTVARSRQARTLLKVAGRADIPVVAGCGTILSPHAEIGFDPRRAYLDQELPIQEAASLPEDKLSALDPHHGVDFIIETVLEGRGDIILVTIGPMTNVAMAITKESHIISRIPRIVSMAGAFDRLFSEWNVRCDPVATALLFGSGIPMDIIGLDVTTKVQLRDEDLAALRRCQSPLAQKLVESIDLWVLHNGWAHRIGNRPIMHDPLAILTLVAPDIVEWHTGVASIELQGSVTYGLTTFVEKVSGPHRYAYSVDTERALSLWMERVAGH